MSRWRIAAICDAAQPLTTKQMLMAVYDLMRWCPTTNNTSPTRITFIVSPAAKERLKPHLNKGNVEQTMLAAYRRGEKRGDW